MKLFEVTTIRGCDEFQTYLGVDYSEALTAKKQALTAFEALDDYDKRQNEVECRVYEIDDDTNITDYDALIDAIVECVGYNPF